MAGIDSGLAQGEELTFETQLHPIIFVGPSIVAAMLLIIGFASFVYNPGVALAALAAAVLIFLIPFLNYRTSRFVVSNRRVLIQVGLVNRRSFEMLLDKVESIAVAQGLFGRMIGFGSVAVIGSGGSREAFHNIASPIEFRREVQAAISNSELYLPSSRPSNVTPKIMVSSAEANRPNRHCTDCGTPTRDGTRFCGQCGSSLNS